MSLSTSNNGEAAQAPISSSDTIVRSRPGSLTTETESVVENEFKDVALDDDATLSPVALASPSEFLFTVIEPVEDLSVDSPSTETVLSVRRKRTSSTATILSIHGLPSSASDDELQDNIVKSNRRSIDGQHKLQEEFARVHRNSVDASADSAIDWGMFLSFSII
jgi:hypothetical protein